MYFYIEQISHSVRSLRYLYETKSLFPILNIVVFQQLSKRTFTPFYFNRKHGSFTSLSVIFSSQCIRSRKLYSALIQNDNIWPVLRRKTLCLQFQEEGTLFCYLVPSKNGNLQFSFSTHILKIDSTNDGAVLVHNCRKINPSDFFCPKS